jgi:HSP20 family protein
MAPPAKEKVMNMLTKWGPFKDWDPVRELDEFQHRLSSFFEQPLTRRGGNGGDLSTWSPAVDIVEDEKEFLVKAELPEVKKEDVHVTVENGVLTIQGERKFEKEEKNKRYHRSERSYGSFTRSFTLPEGADAGKVKAEFKDGLLQIHVTKSEHAKPKQIQVKVE